MNVLNNLLVRKFEIAKSGINKIDSSIYRLKSTDLLVETKSFTPGEWIALTNPSWGGQCVACYVIPFHHSGIQINLFDKTKRLITTLLDIHDIIIQKIEAAISRRERFHLIEDGCRLIYGASDDLNGLVVDLYQNVVIFSIHSAGLDHFFDAIKNFLQMRFPEKKIFYLEQKKLREKEGLVLRGNQTIDFKVNYLENGLRFTVLPEIIQKQGHYFDHRMNRRYLKELINRLGYNFNSGVDLFCYAGSWGIHALTTDHVDNVLFVDQANTHLNIEENFQLNQINKKARFVQDDVFNFLDKTDQVFDLILCDPPAFAKKLEDRNSALSGYSKLLKGIQKKISPKALLSFSSCTHFVTSDDLMNLIAKVFPDEKFKLQLLWDGMQDFDHPIKSKKDFSNYIKCLIYWVEKV